MPVGYWLDRESRRRFRRSQSPTSLSAWHGLAREIPAGDADGASVRAWYGRELFSGAMVLRCAQQQQLLLVGSCLSERAGKLRSSRLVLCVRACVMPVMLGILVDERWRLLVGWLVGASAYASIGGSGARCRCVRLVVVDGWC